MMQSLRNLNVRVVLTVVCFFAISNIMIRLILFLPVMAARNISLPFNMPAGHSMPVGMLLGLVAANCLAALVAAKFLWESHSHFIHAHALFAGILCSLFTFFNPGIIPAPGYLGYLLAALSFLSFSAFVIWLQRKSAG